MDFSKCEIRQEDMVLVAMPSFGGRAPSVAIERFKQIRGNQAKCTIVCVYGNRAYEDTLVEMEDAAREAGFCVIAAVAAVAQHSIMPQYATNRPDAADEKQLADFAVQIVSRKELVANIPGNRSYKKSGGAGLIPKPAKNCIKCGICAANCLVQAIDPQNFKTDSKKCISCMRCIRQCSYVARKVNGALDSIASMAIKKACSIRKENELFL